MRRIMLISADETVVHLLNSSAPAFYANVQVVKPAGDLLQQIKQCKPDLLIIDFILNDDNGGSLCHQVKSDLQFYNLPIILLSEFTSLDRFATKFGCSTIINKPVSLPELTEVIAHLLQLQEAH